MTEATDGSWIVVGASAPLRRAVARRLIQDGIPVQALDPFAPAAGEAARAGGLGARPLTLPPGRVVLLTGPPCRPPRRWWTWLRDSAVLTARLLPQLHGRAVTLASDHRAAMVEAGARAAALRGWWANRIQALAATRPLHHGGFGAADPAIQATCEEFAAAWSGFDQMAGAAALLQEELLLTELGDAAVLRIVRLPAVHGAGRETPMTRSLRRAALSPAKGKRRVPAGARAGVPLEVAVAALCDETPGRHDVAGHRDPEETRRFVAGFRPFEDPLFSPPIEVVQPPRPEDPGRALADIHTALEAGLLRSGPWSEDLAALLTAVLNVSSDYDVVLANSGTSALRVACAALVPPVTAAPRVAVLPSYTFTATGELLAQMGFRLALCDIDPETWTMDPAALARILERIDATIVVSVDALGNPADYQQLRQVCARAGVPFLSDSAASLGSLYCGEAVGWQADAHAFSMSFAKVVTAAGAGGFAVVPADGDLPRQPNWERSFGIGELNAIIALDQVRHLADTVDRRQQVAAIYAEAIDTLSGVSRQHVPAGNQHSYVHWAVRIPGEGRREAVARALDRLGVRTKPYHAPLPHRSGASDLVHTERLANEVLALPMSSEMTGEDAADVALAFRLAMRSVEKDGG